MYLPSSHVILGNLSSSHANSDIYLLSSCTLYSISIVEKSKLCRAVVLCSYLIISLTSLIHVADDHYYSRLLVTFCVLDASLALLANSDEFNLALIFLSDEDHVYKRLGW